MIGMASGCGYILLLAACAISATSVRQKRAAPLGTVMLTDGQRMALLNKHNELRRLESPSNMRYMTWDSKLEWIAEEYGKKCVWEHNPERKKQYGLSSVGENMWKSSGKTNTTSAAVGAVQAWYNEIDYFDYNAHKCQQGKVCGHYTQAVWANTYKVGCAMTVCSDGTTLICDYAPSGNVYDYSGKIMTVFKKGGACSECDAGDYCRTGLCANSSRDFIEQPTEPSQAEHTGLAVTVAVLVIIIVLFIVFTVYRERENIPPKYRFWEKITNRGSNGSAPSSRPGATTKGAANPSYNQQK